MDALSTVAFGGRAVGVCKSKISSKNRVTHSRESNLKQETEQLGLGQTRLAVRSKVAHDDQEDGSNKRIRTHTTPSASWRQLAGFLGYVFKIQVRVHRGHLIGFAMIGILGRQD